VVWAKFTVPKIRKSNGAEALVRVRGLTVMKVGRTRSNRSVRFCAWIRESTLLRKDEAKRGLRRSWQGTSSFFRTYV
jgi:hypothetical protein